MCPADKTKPRKEKVEEWNSHFSAFMKRWFWSSLRYCPHVFHMICLRLGEDKNVIKACLLIHRRDSETLQGHW